MAIKHGTTMKVPYGELFWFEEHNDARHTSLVDTPEEQFRRALIFLDGSPSGWRAGNPVAVIEMTPARAEEAEKRVKQMRVKLAESTVPTVGMWNGEKLTISHTTVLLAFDILHGIGQKSKKTVEKRFEPVYAYQRSKAFLLYVAICIEKGIPYDVDIPCVVNVYKSEYERFQANVLENFGMLAGAKLTNKNWPTIIAMAKKMWEHGVQTGKPLSSRDVEVMVGGGDAKAGHGSGAKAFKIVALDSRMPELKLVDTIVNKAGGQEFCASLSQKVISDFEMGTRELSLQTNAGEGIKQFKEADIAAYLKDPTANADTPVTVVKKTDATKYAGMLKNKKVAYLLIQLFQKGNLKAAAAFESPETVKADNAMMVKLGLDKEAELDEEAKAAIAEAEEAATKKGKLVIK